MALHVRQPDPKLRRGYREVTIIGLPKNPRGVDTAARAMLTSVQRRKGKRK